MWLAKQFPTIDISALLHLYSSNSWLLVNKYINKHSFLLESLVQAYEKINQYSPDSVKLDYEECLDCVFLTLDIKSLSASDTASLEDKLNESFSPLFRNKIVLTIN